MTSKLNDLQDMIKFLKLQIKSRDKTIQNLKIHNSALLKAAFKESAKNVKMSKHAKSLIEINENIKQKLHFDKKERQ